MVSRSLFRGNQVLSRSTCLTVLQHKQYEASFLNQESKKFDSHRGHVTFLISKSEFSKALELRLNETLDNQPIFLRITIGSCG